MQADQQLIFARYRLDLPNAQLWRGNRNIPLTSKAFAVLRYLIDHAGQLVTKAELFDALWPDTVVSDGALTFCIVDLRKALGDNAKAPRFIETVHGRGYRFLGKAVSSQHEEAKQKAKDKGQKAKGEDLPPAPNPQHPAPTVVGRETELLQLQSWLAKALHGERQIVFVTGEAGIGKTTLIETFMFGVRSSETFGVTKSLESRVKTSPKSEPAPSPQPLPPRLWVALGQCIEQYGPGEPYMPILEALGRLCRTPDGEHLVPLLGQYAPTWLVQMPSLLTATELEALQRTTQGATRERMLREMGEAIDAMTAERPLIVVLEDLHWSDASTLELLALLARRRKPARLLVMGTYRPVDVIVQEHPLRAVKQELQLHGLCVELPLGLLSEAQVAEYLEQRFGVKATGQPPLQPLAKAIHRRTDGNPLFMVTAVDDLISQGVLVSLDGQIMLSDDLTSVTTRVPNNLQQLIERHIERVSAEDQRILEVGSVVGMEFSAAAIAAGTQTEPESVEERCEGLARQAQFLRASGTANWPDGTVAARYSFLHALYQEVLYHRIPAGRRRRLHQRIGEREEQAYGEQAREIAAELAVHFEQGRDYAKTVKYLRQAGEHAVGRSAYQEAITHLTKGVKLLKTLPDTPERVQQELRLQINLGRTLSLTKGYGAPEAAYAYVQARALCQHVKEMPQLFQALIGLWSFYLVRAELQTAREMAEQMFGLAQAGPSLLLFGPRLTLGSTLFWLGELSAAREQLEQNLVHCDSQQLRILAASSGENAEAFCLSYVALALWLLGYPDQALRKSEQALLLAQELPFSSGWAGALFRDTWLHQFRQESQATYDRTEAVLNLATEQGFAEWLVHGSILQGWALAELGQREEGIAHIHNGAATRQAIGSALGRTRDLALLAEEYGKAGKAEEGLASLAEAFTHAEKSGERFYEAELYRLKGELTLQKGAGNWGLRAGSSSSQASSHKPLVPSEVLEEAEECFLKAIDIARRQSAKSLELRASTSLARLWQQQGKKKEAHKLLVGIYGWFTEGFDTKDLQEAKALLDELSHSAIGD